MLRTEFKPYVSIITKTVSSVSSIGSPQIQIPFVHGIVLGPIAKPVIRFKRRFDKKLFPERCGPATVATAI
jgi:hypothetical protein